MTTYCKHGEYRDRCREPECRADGGLNLSYVGRQQCRAAIAARIADDLPYLIGFLYHDYVNAPNEQEARHIMAIISSLEGACKYVETEVRT